jgi:hypothetical protein
MIILIRKGENIFQKVFYGFFTVFLILITFVYIATIVKELNVAVVLLFVTIGLTFLGSAIFSFMPLFKSKTIIGVIIFYLIFSFTFIVFFGYLYNVANIFKGNVFKTVSEEINMSSVWDYIYFSSGN